MSNLEIMNKIEQMIDKFGFIGQVNIYQDHKLIVKVKANNTDYYPVHKYSELFINLLIMRGLERNNISLNQTLDLYLPEMNKASKITFLNLLKSETGLPDLHGVLTTAFHQENTYFNMTDDEKESYDFNFRNVLIPIEQVIEMYNQYEFENEPGSFNDYNQAVQNLGPLIIERIYNKPYLEVLESELLGPSGINPHDDFNHERSYNAYYNVKKTFALTNLENFIGLQIDDIAKLYHNLKSGNIISLKHFRIMKKLTPYDGINFCSSFSFTDHLVVGKFYIFDFKKENIQFIHATDFSGYEVNINGEDETFYNYYVPQLAPYFLKYNQPKLVKLSKKNVYDLLYIENDPKQLWFMGSTKYMLAEQYTDPKVRLYLLMDNNVTLGTVCLKIDQGSNIYYISNVLVDRKYQGRGYGKAIIREALKILKKNGAKIITIDVDKDNIAAFKIYLNAGFILKSTYPRSYHLVYTFD